jgi:[ribosomal protein S5]-alanine N-acetyltransferase
MTGRARDDLSHACRPRVRTEDAALQHEPAFLAAVRRSRELHRPWVSPPDTRKKFRAYLGRCGGPAHHGYLVLTGEGELAGVINLNEIVRGVFQSAYLGYYAFAPHAGQGYMRRGLDAVLRRAFRELGLHRLEANIQPANTTSIALAKRAGFRREGYSERYLKIGGRWRDHERWAILREDWHARPLGARER